MCTPTLLESVQHIFIKRVAVNSGGKHCLALSSEGDVFSWGEGDDGKLGHDNKNSCDRPRVIEALRGKDVVDISCGGAHSAGKYSILIGWHWIILTSDWLTISTQISDWLTLNNANL